MVTFEEAHRIVLSHSTEFGTEQIPLEESIGRALIEDWATDRDMPPYDRVTMDGIAIHYESAKEAAGRLMIKGVAAAGSPRQTINDQKTCLEIMTGAILPIGADTVIRYEDLNIEDGVVQITTDYKKGQNIHYQGEDRRYGEVVVHRGNIISPAEIGVGASIGKTMALVSRLPRTLIVSTGDELVEVERIPAPHQIRSSNVYQIACSLKEYGIKSDRLHIVDDYYATLSELEQMMDRYDLFILSGGVSKGKFDFVPNALADLGIEKHFHRVQQRPGKPFWFGTHPKGLTVFALPGNPISSFMCTRVYLLEWLRLSMGLKNENQPHGILAEDVQFKPALTYFLEVKLAYTHDGQIIAHPMRGNGSGDLANLTNADAFIKLPQGKELYKKGESYPIYIYR